MPTTSGMGVDGGRPFRRFSSQYRMSQCSGVVAAKLVRASVGVRTCLPKLALGSFGKKGLISRAKRALIGPPGSSGSRNGGTRISRGNHRRRLCREERGLNGVIASTLQYKVLAVKLLLAGTLGDCDESAGLPGLRL